MKNFKVLQLIDSLSAGGAERMSVNIANALAEEESVESFLCATRFGGALERSIDPRVKHLILHKRAALDPGALWSLVRFIRQHRIEIIHAHATSWFMAVQCKLFTGVKVVWHDHYGKSEQLASRSISILRPASYLFDSIVSVNNDLKRWAERNLHIQRDRLLYMPNFAELSPKGNHPALPGERRTRIVCLANLRPQKDHHTLIEAFEKVIEKVPNCHLLLVGHSWNDAYSQSIERLIEEKALSSSAHLLGSRIDTADILKECSIGVLASESEGLPVALLEYGLAELAAVCTDVGECARVLGDGKYGKIVLPKDPQALAEALVAYLEDEAARTADASAFRRHVQKNYSKAAAVKKLLSIYTKVLYETS